MIETGQAHSRSQGTNLSLEPLAQRQLLLGQTLFLTQLSPSRWITSQPHLNRHLLGANQRNKRTALLEHYCEKFYVITEKLSPNLITTADAIPALATQKALDLFDRYNVLSNRELTARSEVLLEQYYKIIRIEARILMMMLSTKVLPAALRYQGELALIVQSSHEASVECSRSAAKLGDLARLAEQLQGVMESLQTMIQSTQKNNLQGAEYVCNTILPEMSQARLISDQIEETIPSDIWPLPTYTDMLFIR